LSQCPLPRAVARMPLPVVAEDKPFEDASPRRAPVGEILRDFFFSLLSINGLGGKDTNEPNVNDGLERA